MHSLRASLLVVFAGALVGVLAASCGSTRKDCSPTDCGGCCDSAGECQPGFLNDACGVNGSVCQQCSGNTSCGNGTCITVGGGGNKDAGGNCKGLGGACLSGAECCSGNCDNQLCASNVSPDSGTPDAGGNCKGAGAACLSPAECCSNDCSGNVCGGGTPGCSNITGTRAEQVCLRWKCDRADRNEGTWTGQTASCLPGDNTVGRQNALKMVNLQRFLAQLPEVTDEATRNQKAQECAVMMTANGQLNHYPPNTWTCYTADGAQAASSSNLATTPGVAAIDLYMVDPGNSTTLGHRRWILSNSLGPVGSGTTNAYSCLWVIGGSGNAGKAYTAWPPPGPFPLEGFAPGGFSSLNQTGWSVQSDSLSLQGAMVTITDNGTSLPVTVTTLGAGYGSAQAISIIPQGWQAQADHSYVVSVTGIPVPISYTVDVINCP